MTRTCFNTSRPDIFHRDHRFLLAKAWPVPIFMVLMLWVGSGVAETGMIGVEASSGALSDRRGVGKFSALGLEDASELQQRVAELAAGDGGGVDTGAYDQTSPLSDRWIQQIKISQNDGVQGDQFGWSVSISGDTAAISSSMARAAWVFVREGDLWLEQGKLTVPLEGNISDNFGESVAVWGDIVLVGATTALVDGKRQGAVYVFAREDGAWAQQSRLTASDGGMGACDPSCDAFGVSIGFDGSHAVVGASAVNVEEYSQQGAAYVYAYDDGEWSEQTRLVASDGGEVHHFGTSVAVSGDRLIVGALKVNTGEPGAAYVFARSGGVWSEQAKLIASDGVAQNAFGLTVDIRDDIAIVGAPLTAVAGNFAQGAAYVFSSDGAAWNEAAKLVASDGAMADTFGWSVALAEETALVGADKLFLDHVGSAYVFAENGGDWDEQVILSPSDGGLGFGWSVAISDGAALIGAPVAMVGNVRHGAAYVFDDTVPPADFAVLEGVIDSLSYCHAGAVPLEGAVVEIMGQHNTYTRVTDGNGHYQVFLSPDESPVSVSVSAGSHLPVQDMNIGFGADDHVIRDFDLVFAAPCVTAEPSRFEFELEPGVQSDDALIIGNLDGGVDLTWSITSAGPPAATAWFEFGDAGVDCEGELGLIRHDDGSIEDGYSVNADLASNVVLVDKFTPSVYPTSFRAVCLAWVTLGPAALDYEVVIFADDGPGGTPGTQLGALPTTVTDIPVLPATVPDWVSVDIADLGIVVESGSVYIGVRWTPSAPYVLLAMDESPHNPPGFAGGYRWTDYDNTWTLLQNALQNYRSLFIRAVETLGGCADPDNFPWLALDQTAGVIAVGDSLTLALDIDTTGLAPGRYGATLCLESNDPDRPLIAVPVELAVLGEPGPGVLQANPSSLEFEGVSVGTLQTRHFSTANAALPGADDLEITDLHVASGTKYFSITGGTCGVGTLLRPDTDCSVLVTFHPSHHGQFTGTILIETGDAQAIVVELAGEAPPGPPAILVSPPSLSATTAFGGSDAHTLSIANAGEAVLEWAVADEGDLDGRLLRPAGRITTHQTRPPPGPVAGVRQALPVGPDQVIATHSFVPAADMTTLTHSASMDIWSEHAAACAHEEDGTTVENQFLRTFTLTDFGISGAFQVSEVSFGVEQLTAAADITINLYTLDGDFLYGNMTLIGSHTETLQAQSLSLVTVPVTATVPPRTTLVVEIAAPDLSGEGAFLAGANDLGETAPSYLASTPCELPEPTLFGNIIFARSVHLAIAVSGKAEALDCALPAWVGIDPVAGSVPESGAQPVSVLFDATGVSAGEHEGRVCLVTNDPDQPYGVLVPLALTVLEPAPAIAVHPAVIDFAQVPAGTSTEPSAVTIESTGTAALEVSLVTDPGAGFALTGGDCDAAPFVLEPDTSCTLEYTFTPPAEGVYSSIVTIVSNADPGTSAVALTGTGGAAVVDGLFGDRFEIDSTGEGATP